MDVLDGYLTRSEFAKQIGKSLRTIDRWEAERRGPARIKVGKLILYRAEAVEAWLTAHETAPVRKFNSR